MLLHGMPTINSEMDITIFVLQARKSMGRDTMQFGQDDSVSKWKNLNPSSWFEPKALACPLKTFKNGKEVVTCWSKRSNLLVFTNSLDELQGVY